MSHSIKHSSYEASGVRRGGHVEFANVNRIDTDLAKEPSA